LSVVALIAQGCGGDDETGPAVAAGGSSGTAGTANGGDGNGGDGNGGDGNGGDGNGGEGNGGDGPGDAAAGAPGDGDGDGGDGDGGDGDGDGGDDSGILDGGSVGDGSVGDGGLFTSDASLLTDAGNSFFCPGTPADGDPCFPGGTQCLYTGGVECTCNNPPGPNNSTWGCSQ
jgi:hypothetical protein